ncbi:MAG: glycosyltransferase family 2 protein [Planctomycetota bacterium]
MSDHDPRRPGDEAEEHRTPSRAVLIAAGNLLVVAACVYLVARGMLLLWAEYKVADMILAILLLLSEIFVMFHSLSFMIDLLSAARRRPPPIRGLDAANAPSVAVFVPARHEPRDVLDATFTCLENLDYPNKILYLLDDSSLPEYQKEAEDVAATHGARLFRRPERRGAKAGIINDCLKTVDAKYIAILDCDQNPLPDFLRATVPHLEANPRLAFVQTPQFYTNIATSAVAAAANLQHCIFYEYICEGKGKLGSMICCGTNDVIRKTALEDVGGFDETSVTEDFSTSVDFQMKGWESLYDGQVSVFGKGPETLGPYLRQQWRWARGNIGVFKKILRCLLTHPRGMGFWRWWDYIATGTYYLIGWAYFFLMLCPIMFVFFDIPSFFMRPEVYFLTFLPYFTLSVTLFYGSMGKRGYKLGQVLMAQALGFVAIPIYMMAAVSALLNLKAAFTITTKSKVRATPLRIIWPQVALWLANYAAIVWAINRAVAERDPAILLSLVWILYHFALLSAVFPFRYAGHEEKADVDPKNLDMEAARP